METTARKREDTEGWALPVSFWGKKLFPADQDQGDPYFTLVNYPDGSKQWYCYHTGEDEQGGVFAYSSSNFVHWEALGTVFVHDPAPNDWAKLSTETFSYAGRSHWAPCVKYLPTLADQGLPPCLAIVSRGRGRHGRAAHQLHTLEVWEAWSMKGPFHPTGIDLTPERDFAIDADVFYDPFNQQLMLAYSRTFYDHPIGAGTVVVPIANDLSQVLGEAVFTIRGTETWQIYERNRVMDLDEKLDFPAHFWNEAGTEVHIAEWTTVEGWAGGYINRFGWPCHFYSGGCYGAPKDSGLEYAVGVVIQDENGYTDITKEYGHFAIRSSPENKLYDPGHGSVVQGPEGRMYYGLHFKDSRDSPRQAALLPIAENEVGWPYLLTTF